LYCPTVTGVQKARLEEQIGELEIRYDENGCDSDNESENFDWTGYDEYDVDEMYDEPGFYSVNDDDSYDYPFFSW